MHLDIKPENIFIALDYPLSSNGEENAEKENQVNYSKDFHNLIFQGFFYKFQRTVPILYNFAYQFTAFPYIFHQNSLYFHKNSQLLQKKSTTLHFSEILQVNKELNKILSGNESTDSGHHSGPQAVFDSNSSSPVDDRVAYKIGDLGTYFQIIS